MTTCEAGADDSACGSASGRTWELHRCTGSSAPWTWHSHTCGGAWEGGTRGAAPCGQGEGCLGEVGAGGSNQAEVEEASEEDRKVLEGAWRRQSAVQSQGWVGVKMRGPLFVRAG